MTGDTSRENRSSEAGFEGAAVPFRLRVPPEKLVILKFILEAYEGLGVLRTVDRQMGLVIIMTLEDTADAVSRLLEELREELCLTEIRRGEGAEDDWLAER